LSFHLCTIARTNNPCTLQTMEFSLSQAEIIEIVQASSTRGATTEKVHGIASLQAAHPGDLSFLGNPK